MLIYITFLSRKSIFSVFKKRSGSREKYCGRANVYSNYAVYKHSNKEFATISMRIIKARALLNVSCHFSSAGPICTEPA